MPIWFYAPDFRLSSTPSILDSRIVPAYHATFQKNGTPDASIKLCMLHDDDLAAFPYHGPLAEAFAIFSQSRMASNSLVCLPMGLSVVMTRGYVFVVVDLSGKVSTVLGLDRLYAGFAT